VLGSGPAGLIAAHAAVTAGHSVVILSNNQFREPQGCQYLHEPIPGVDCGKGKNLLYSLQGTEAGYRSKVYGESFGRIPVSPHEQAGPQTVWDLRLAYANLCKKYWSLIVEATVTPEWLDEATGIAGQDRIDWKILSTIPAPTLCRRISIGSMDAGGALHVFHYVKGWAVGGTNLPIQANPFTVVCDGTKDVGYSRISNVFGYQTIEYPWRDGRKPPLEGISEITKPITTNCDCRPNIVRLGRYGKWHKGSLAHTVYAETMEALGNG
jgi:hypothetical protein